MHLRTGNAVLLAAGPSGGAASGADIALAGGVYRVEGTTLRGEPAGGWETVFHVHAGTEEAPALLGTYVLRAGVLEFAPRFRPSAGMKTVAVYSGEGKSVRKEFAGEVVELKAAAVLEGIYPSAEVVPANLLKLYLQFSGPMTRGMAWENLKLLDAAGNALDLPFLELDQELWDSGQTRLTVLFDPGRIKRGVLPREESGTALEAGRKYTLVVGGRWEDANGQSLGREYRKEFRTGPEERRAVDPGTWKVSAPRAGTREPLRVTFDRPMDHALALRLIRVEGIAGESRLLDGDRLWEFVPSGSWKRGTVQLAVETRLEDLAGNRVGKPFDVDVFDKVTKQVREEVVRLAVRIRE
jgi:hypothetical protein